MRRFHGVIPVLVLTTAMGGWPTHGPASALARTVPGAAIKGPAASMDVLLTKLYKMGQFQGTVLFARKGKVLLTKGYGTSDLSFLTKDRAGTEYSVGSITKQFTAMAILQLQEQGKLSVKDSICSYVSSCPAAWQPITLHMLLTHTSGIPDFPNRSTDPTKPMSHDQMLAQFEREPLDFPPGERWSYSNAGYDLLGLVIEKVSGETWAAYLKQHIFNPLGMTHSGIESSSDPPAHAAGYRGILLNTPLPSVPIDPSLVYSAGSLYSTVGDLYTWDLALSTDKLVSSASRAAMFAPQVPLSQDNSTQYGYGWFLTSLSGHQLVFHGGLVSGFATINLMAPKDGITVILLSNDESADVPDIGVALAEIALGLNPGLKGTAVRIQ